MYIIVFQCITKISNFRINVHLKQKLDPIFVATAMTGPKQPARTSQFRNNCQRDQVDTLTNTNDWGKELYNNNLFFGDLD